MLFDEIDKPTLTFEQPEVQEAVFELPPVDEATLFEIARGPRGVRGIQGETGDTGPAGGVDTVNGRNGDVTGLAEASDVEEALSNKVSGTVRITVGDTPPENPSINDIWVDTS